MEEHPLTVHSYGLLVSQARPMHHMKMQCIVFKTDSTVKFGAKLRRQTSPNLLTVIQSLSHIMHICAYGTLYLPPPSLEDTKFTITCKCKSKGALEKQDQAIWFCYSFNLELLHLVEILYRRSYFQGQQE